MPALASYLVTGATSGLGLQVALRLAEAGGHQLILPVRSDAGAATIRQALGPSNSVDVSTPRVDLASLASVEAFVQAFQHEPATELRGVLLNAGVQSARALEFTADGHETSFAVNHLGHWLLIQGLLGHLAPGARVGWTASGVHDPGETAARLFGFRGGRYTSAAKLASGAVEPGVPAPQACRDAYASSKLCNVIAARALAARRPDAATFFSYDPGLLPGTGLARRHGAASRWLWHHVLPRLASVLPMTSTPAKASVVLAGLLTGKLPVAGNGAYFGPEGSERGPAAQALDPQIADELVSGSTSLLRAHSASTLLPTSPSGRVSTSP